MVDSYSFLWRKWFARRRRGKDSSVADIGHNVLSTVQSNLSERCPGLQTNNRAELIALIRALEEAPPGGERSRLIIKTDSKYSISCVQLWARHWESRGWVKPDGQDVLNAVRLNSSLSIAYVIFSNVYTFLCR